MNKYTVIGEYWDNEQSYASRFTANDVDHAIDQAQDEASNKEAPYEPDEAETPLRIWAVLAGWPKVLYTHDV